MSGFVVDASVVIKWYLPEPFTEHAVRLRESGAAFDAPDLLYAEVGNVLWKRVQRGELARENATAIAEALALMPIEAHPSRLLATAALQIACTTKLTVYDCLYAAAALLTGFPLVTADRRLHETARRTRHLRGRVLWIEEVPEVGAANQV